MKDRQTFVTAADLVRALQKCNPLDKVLIEEDASLIAAAPDLLAACADMLAAQDKLSEPGYVDDPDTLAHLYRGMEMARAAIRRAEEKS